MATTVIIVLRTILALALGLFGTFVCSVGLYLSVNRDFVFFSGQGLLMLGCYLVGAGTMYASARLFRSTLRLPSGV